jgi:hypothetical protein
MKMNHDVKPAPDTQDTQDPAPGTKSGKPLTELYLVSVDSRDCTCTLSDETVMPVFVLADAQGEAVSWDSDPEDISVVLVVNPQGGFTGFDVDFRTPTIH